MPSQVPQLLLLVATHHSRTHRQLTMVSKAALPTAGKVLMHTVKAPEVLLMARSSLAVLTLHLQLGVALTVRTLVIPPVGTVPKHRMEHSPQLPPQQHMAQLVLPRQGMGHPRQGMAPLLLLRQGMARVGLLKQGMAQIVLLKQGMGQQQQPQQAMAHQQLHQHMAIQRRLKQHMAQLVLPKQGTSLQQLLLFPVHMVPPQTTPAHTQVTPVPQVTTAQATLHKHQRLQHLPAMLLKGITLKLVLGITAAVAITRVNSHKLPMVSSPMHSLLLSLHPSQHMVPTSRAQLTARLVERPMVAPHSRYSSAHVL